MTDLHSPAALLGRDRELSQLLTLVRHAHAGRSGTLVVTGTAGIGKTALLDRLATLVAGDMRVVRMVAAESEMELTYAGLQLLCGPLMPSAEGLSAPQLEALDAAFGLRGSEAPNPLVLSLAVRNLLERAAGAGSLLCIIDDAQWLDNVSARTIASVARRLSDERIALVMASRRQAPPLDDLPHLTVTGLADHHARALLRGALAGAIDERVADQLIVESSGNPLALRELPRSLSPSDLAGGFALASSIPLESRIEQSLLAQLATIPAATHTLLLLAAADPTGDTGLLWRAGAILGLGPEHLDHAQQVDALVVSGRVSFRHPLIRSAIYRSASPAERRAVHAALADATYEERDPDRRAWHRASATVLPDEDVADGLVRSADRARTRGGMAASAAFLERAAELTPDPEVRADRVLAAAESKLDAGAATDALRLVNTIRDLSTSRQEAMVDHLRARAEYALRRDRSAPRRLLRAAQALEPYNPQLARDTYLLALTAATYAGRLGEPGAAKEIAAAVLAATDDDRLPSAGDLILRGQALLCGEGPAAARSTVRQAIDAFRTAPAGAGELQRMWVGGRAAQDVWDADGLRALAERQVEVARSTGVLTVLPMALNLLMVVRTFDGDLDEAERICDDIDAILLITGHSLPPYGRAFLAAYRGRVEEVELRAAELRADAQARGEGYGLTVANLAEALVYNGAGRYEEAVASARGELPYAHELGHAMRTLLELIEAATRTGEKALAEVAYEQLTLVTPPRGESDWSDAFMALAQAQLCDGDEAARLYQRAIELFGLIRVPMLRGRGQLLYGEMLRRQGRRIEARDQLRAAFDVLTKCGMAGFADRARRELNATGERVRPRTVTTTEELTDQELAIAQLARDGLTNREIGARLFISAHTVDWHLRKVFTKLAIKSRKELHLALRGPRA
ncbi:AAA family ATPase [Kribbella sp. NPDC048915]|uniref:ATP-binding protein n=1 Tax=Kribbella sp. NPDC048915 TaxID=3155148 RepID=UPI0033CD2CE8